MFKILVILQQQFHKNSKMHIKTLLNTICFNTLQNVQRQLKIQKIIVFNILDPFVANPNNIQISNNDFIFILVLFLLGTWYFFYGIDPNFKMSDIFSKNYYMKSKYIYYHQTYSKTSWGIGEIISIVAFTAVICHYCVFVFVTNLKQKICPPFLNCSNSESETLKIVKCRKNDDKFYKFNFLFFYTYYMWFASKMVIKNGMFIFNWQNTIFWFFTHPVTASYYIWSKFCKIKIKYF